MKSILLSLLLACPLLCSAQDDVSRHRLDIGVNISTEDTYDFGAGYHYMICDYVGMGGHVGVWSFFPDGGILGETEEERSDRENFYFKPSILLVSPKLFNIGDCSFRMECEPSLMISTRQTAWAEYKDSEACREYRTDCLSWHCNVGLAVTYRNVSFAACYEMSNLDVKREYDGNDSDSFSKKLINNIGIKVGVRF